MTKLQELTLLGQAVWLDYIRRSLITSGDLQSLIHEGVRGVYSNLTIIEKAIAGSADYDQELRKPGVHEKSVEEIYEAFCLDDIARAADLLHPVYEATGGADGYASLDLKPSLADDTEGSIAEGKRLFAFLGRPNVMIKVPSTPAGIRAVETLIGEGVNVNATLIFSKAQYEAAAEAYIRGLEKLASAGGDLVRTASVASFFINKVDRAVGQVLDEKGESSLQWKIAIANAKEAYTRFVQIFRGERWEDLEARGARVQRILWAGTGTQNPHYPDTLYVDSLIGPDTVNAVHPDVLSAFRCHGTVTLSLESGMNEAKAQLARLEELGVDMQSITRNLQDQAVASSVEAFDSLLSSITEKRKRLLSNWQCQEASLGEHKESVETALAEAAEKRIIHRIWDHDHTVWKPEPDEISNRLGWLHIAGAMIENIRRLEALSEEVRSSGYTHALLLGMGGSSLAPEVMRKTFGVAEGYLDLAVLDSTDPAAVLACSEGLDLSHSLFIVSTKSGGTVETLSFFKFFYNRVAEALGVERAGEHFIAVTDPGSRLADLAKACDFRATFLNDPNIGGRYSVLSFFGLVPAALIGLDLGLLLDRALTAASNCEPCNSPINGDNNGARLGVIMAELAKSGRDKLTFICSERIASFRDWVEQLIAESTGKEGRGILPVVGEEPGSPEVYGHDRFFVHLRLDGDETQDAAVAALESAGYPVIRIRLRDIYELGAQFFLWEMATAVAGHRLGINPFYQPDVESAKQKAREMVSLYKKRGALEDVESATLKSNVLKEFLDQAKQGDYAAFQAYLQPTKETDAALKLLRLRVRNRFKLATTVGYGPRFLHSTGQLHKGDAGRGLFIQFTAHDRRDAPIPDEAGSDTSSITFGVLKRAQALGDMKALEDKGRRIIRFHLGEEVLNGLRRLVREL